VILVDSSVWIDHLRARDEALSASLADGKVLSHPFVIGEVALGTIRPREAVLVSLQKLPSATVAAHGDVMHLIERYRLFGRGIGYIDAHLLAAVRLTPPAMLWTRDRRLLAVAINLGLAARLPH
jgi:predicted nucleic acid-binding protein